ncbi:hypothetical protein KKC65_02445 [Patescibacteria group bacterium]|nr:hypothetical protein [Patescibacteria group bacterium]
METKKYKIKVYGEECLVELMDFNKNDGKNWKRLFDIWKKLKMGMRDYKSREPNFPEGLSEVACRTQTNIKNLQKRSKIFCEII